MIDQDHKSSSYKKKSSSPSTNIPPKLITVDLPSQRSKKASKKASRLRTCPCRVWVRCRRGHIPACGQSLVSSAPSCKRHRRRRSWSACGTVFDPNQSTNSIQFWPISEQYPILTNQYTISDHNQSVNSIRSWQLTASDTDQSRNSIDQSWPVKK